ncbi:hypothetical protein ABZY81_39460 [Streptomyces sp. NPDC006514]|uniref:hypothetical protein n=1 Tax=Streptomyces sp. NPDC006514 TaxID=3154308 RepID=UPI0033B4CF8A
MQQVGESDSTHTVARNLNRLTADSSWRRATGTALVGRLVDAALASLTTPPGAAGASRPWVSPAAARSCSTTTPATTTSAAAAPGVPAPAEAAVPAHRQRTAPARAAGRGR